MSGGSEAPSIKLGDGSVYFLISQRLNKTIRRREVLVSVHHAGRGTPSRREAASAISKLLGVGEDLVVIKRIEGEYGREASRIWANVYEDRADLERFEPKYLLARGGKKSSGGEGG